MIVLRLYLKKCIPRPMAEWITFWYYSKLQHLLLTRLMELEGLEISIYKHDPSVGIKVIIYGHIKVPNWPNSSSVILYHMLEWVFNPLHIIFYKNLQVKSSHTVSKVFLSRKKNTKFIYSDVLTNKNIWFKS